MGAYLRRVQALVLAQSIFCCVSRSRIANLHLWERRCNWRYFSNSSHLWHTYLHYPSRHLAISPLCLVCGALPSTSRLDSSPFSSPGGRDTLRHKIYPSLARPAWLLFHKSLRPLSGLHLARSSRLQLRTDLQTFEPRRLSSLLRRHNQHPPPFCPRPRQLLLL